MIEHNPDLTVALNLSTIENEPNISLKTVSAIESEYRLAARNLTELYELRNNVRHLADYLQASVDNEDISTDEATAIAEIFGLSLNKKVSLTVKVQFDITVSVPADEEISIYDFDFSAESSDYGIEDTDYTISDWYEN